MLKFILTSKFIAKVIKSRFQKIKMNEIKVTPKIIN